MVLIGCVFFGAPGGSIRWICNISQKQGERMEGVGALKLDIFDKT